MAKLSPALAAVDLGSSKVGVLICEVRPEGLEVVGFGQAPSRGIRRGVIVHIEAATEAFQEALEQAERFAKRNVDHFVVGVSGAHIQSLNSHGMIPVRDKEIRDLDIQKVLEAASAVQLPLDREIIQLIPREYVVDGEGKIREPRGMYARRLEAHIQLITGSITTLQNIRRALSKSNIHEFQFISAPLAMSRATLTQEEKEAGVCVVDIGAASTDLAIFQEGVLTSIRSLSIGGMHLTSDLAVGLKLTLAEAEKLKIQWGLGTAPGLGEVLEIQTGMEEEFRRIDRRMLSTILEPRLEEILDLIRNELAKEGLDGSLPSGVVLTGGASLTRGFLEFAQREFPLPVRLGKPSKLGGLTEMISSPLYSQLVGLAQLGFEGSSELKKHSSFYQKKGLQRFQARVAQFIEEFF